MAIKNILNIDAFKKLISTYKSITLEQLELSWDSVQYDCIDTIIGENVLKHITGFGSTKLCKLCTAIEKLLKNDDRSICNFCIYSKIEDYEDGECACIKHFTYNLISKSTNPEELYDAIQARIAYMESILEELKID